jgi:hypothetical protein
MKADTSIAARTLPASTGALAVLAALALTGCLAQYGSDFGHWSSLQENVPLYRVDCPTPLPPPVSTQTVAILPALGSIPERERRALDSIILQTARQTLCGQTVAVDPAGPMANYLTSENLLTDAGGINLTEAALIGAVLESAYILTVHVQELEPLPPQRVVMVLNMMDTAKAIPVASVAVCLRAQDQRTQMELAEYLKVRIARKYDHSSLDLILRSPTEFQTFAMVRSLQTLNTALWQPPPDDPRIKQKRAEAARR